MPQGGYPIPPAELVVGPFGGELYDFLEERADYTKRYYPGENIFLVTGHTPTVLIPGWGKAEVYREHGHIALDCACVAGGKLAAFCVETQQVIYVDGNI